MVQDEESIWTYSKSARRKKSNSQSRMEMCSEWNALAFTGLPGSF